MRIRLIGFFGLAFSLLVIQNLSNAACDSKCRERIWFVRCEKNPIDCIVTKYGICTLCSAELKGSCEPNSDVDYTDERECQGSTSAIEYQVVPAEQQCKERCPCVVGNERIYKYVQAEPVDATKWAPKEYIVFPHAKNKFCQPKSTNTPPAPE